MRRLVSLVPEARGKLMADAVSRLDTDGKAAVLLHEVEELSFVDIGRVMQLSGASVSELYWVAARQILDFIDEATLVDLQSAESADGKNVHLVPVSAALLDLLRRNPEHIYQLTPDEFELFVCDRLRQMGMEVKRVGSIYSPDGGVDLIAWPKVFAFPYLLAVQVKHHRKPQRKTGVSAVNQFGGVLVRHAFQAGMIVTSTTFTPNAQSIAQEFHTLVMLRDLKDIRRWVADNFLAPEEFREMPSQITLAPGVTVKTRGNRTL